MCGIAGKIILNKKGGVSENLLGRMAQAIKHRGPDDQGVWISSDRRVGLANRRLAIIDLSSKAHQPMLSPDGKLAITFNGEIYNFQEIKRKLGLDKFWRFRSSSDTEVVLALYERYGVECLKYLRGMFALAIWDERRRRLFLARDRLGKKPLKYAFVGTSFLFASELKSILKDPSVKTRPDLEAINHYLTFQYVPAPWTGFQGIKKLPPAHYLIVKPDGSCTLRRYWQLDLREHWQLSEKEWIKLILEKLEESVKLRLISDVPLGAFLSGGVDSSTIVALMAGLSARPVKTFSIGFKEKSHDETPHARRIAKRFKTEHHEFTVEPDAIKLLPELARHYEEPYADSSALPTWYLSELTRKYVAVALNGDGGDENFAGYMRYPYWLFDKNYLRLIPPLARKLFILPLSKFALALRPGLRIFQKAARYAALNMVSSEERYLNYVCYFNEFEKSRVLSSKEIKKFAHQSPELLVEWFRRVKANSPLDKVLAVDIEHYLPEDLLVKVDMASMRHSLEARSPLLDHEFMELAAKIPPELKLKGWQTKHIFKKAVSQVIPIENIKRAKMGFGVPLVHWFRHEGFQEYAGSILLDGQALVGEFLDQEFIAHLLQEHSSNRQNYANEIWALLTLEHWLRAYF